MPADHQVTAVHDTDHWEGKYGAMVTYIVELEGVEGRVSVNQKPETPPVAVGMGLFGEVTDTDRGKKFKKEQRDGGSKGGGGFTPEKEKRIERMAAHKTAAHLLSVAVQLGVLTPEMVQSRESLMKAHGALADALIADLP